MKRLLLLLFITIIAVPTFVIHERNVAQIFNVTGVTSDDNGNIYIIDNKDYKTRVLKMDSKGNIQYTIDTETNEKQFFISFAELAVDHDENLYVRKTKVDSQSYEAVMEVISKYDRNGKFVEDVFTMATSPKDFAYLANIKAISCDGSYIYVYSGDKEVGEVYSISLNEQNKIEKINEIQGVDEELLQDVVVADADTVYLSDKHGNLYHAGKEGVKKQISLNEKDPSQRAILTNLSMDLMKNLYFTDLSEIQLVQVNPKTWEMNTVIKGNDDLNTQYSLKFADLSNITMSLNGNVMASCQINEKSALVVFTEDETKVIKNFDFNGQHYIIAGLFYILGLVVAYLVLTLIKDIYVKFMNRKIPILIKQGAFILPFIVISMFAISTIVESYIVNMLEDEIYTQLYTISKLTAEKVDIEKVNQLNGPESFLSETYLELENEILVDLSEVDGLIDGQYDKYVYSEIYRFVNGEIRAVINSDGNTVSYPKKFMSENKLVDRRYKEAYRDKSIQLFEYTDKVGVWMGAVAPIFDDKKEVVALLEVGMSKANYLDYISSYSEKIRMLNLATTLPLVLILMLTLYISLRPLRVLQKGVSEIAANKLDTVIETKSRDELGDFAKVVNKMASNLKAQIEEMTRYNQAYYKFVPQQIMSLLGNNNVLEVSLGKCIKKELAVFVLNIRDFYKISSEMQPEETFIYINNAFNLVAPIVRENGGIIVHYTDTGLIAFFADKPQASLQAAIMAQEAVMAYNKRQEGQRHLDIGIAIHKGSVMLGIIGEEMRLEPAAISEDVHITSMLEQLSVTFGSNIVVSGALMESLDAGTYGIRNMGSITYKERAITLYDCFDGDALETKEEKREYLLAFVKGVELYQMSQFYQTRIQFIDIVKKCPTDKMAKIYLYLSDTYLNHGKPEDWNPSVNFKGQSEHVQGWEM